MTARDDERFMRRALALAEQARGLTSPNPMVGAVVVRDGEIVGEGFHEAAGRPHAEIVALAAAGPAARGGTLYVTLEPCTHHGRTPPCAPAVIESGVQRVVVAIRDPNPAVDGRGLERLRAAGIAVTTGVLAAEAGTQNRVFLTAVSRRRPHVTLKAALTVDGRIADAARRSRWITGPAARMHAHRLRSESDAIVVGIGTVLCDDPLLTVRLDRPWPREPYRVVLDTAARTPVHARLITAATPARALIAAGERAPDDRARALAGAGATVLRLPEREGRVDLAALLAALAAREVRGVLVEGGSEVAGAFVAAGLVDRAAFFVAPKILGGRTAPGAAGGPGRTLAEALRLGPLEVQRVGEDLLIEADVLHPGPAPAPAGGTGEAVAGSRS